MPLEVEGATRLFAPRRGLDGVSLRLEPGRIYGLLGPNGAGKTSLIRAICGRLRLTSGRVALLGQDPRAVPAARRRLGLVPQRLALHDDLRVEESLGILARLAGVPRGEAPAAVREGLEAAALTDRARTRVATLSGGMKRRLNLVAGILHRPAVLLLDEPSVGIDPDARLRVHALLERVREQGTAILLTTHDLDEAARLSDRIGFLAAGRLRTEGTLEALIDATFKGADHVELRFADEPDATQTEALEKLGLRPSEDTSRWIGIARDALEHASSYVGGLEHLGLDLQQRSVIRPGLREIFLHTTGAEFVA